MQQSQSPPPLPRISAEAGSKAAAEAPSARGDGGDRRNRWFTKLPFLEHQLFLPCRAFGVRGGGEGRRCTHPYPKVFLLLLRSPEMCERIGRRCVQSTCPSCARAPSAPAADSLAPPSGDNPAGPCRKPLCLQTPPSLHLPLLIET